MSAFPWILFYILLAASIAAAFAVLPYSLSLNKSTVDKVKAAASEPSAKKTPPLPVMILLGTLQTVVLFGLAVFVGLLAAQKTGLDLPVLKAALNGQPVGALILRFLPMSLLLAAISWALMMVLEHGYFVPRIPKSLSAADVKISFWKRVLACFYGGFAEEVLLRLFVMSGLAWLLGLVWKTAAGTPTVGAFWTANLLAAVLFGLGHLPATRAITPLTPAIVARAVVLNGLPGVACGYLFMTYGLEAAILCHFTLDIFLHLITAQVMGLWAPKSELHPAD